MPTPARRCAYEVVRRVFERGAYADRALRSEADRNRLNATDRAFATQLAYGTVQRKATLDHLIGLFSERSAGELDGAVVAALRLGLYQLVYLGGVADHAAVDESVELAKQARSRGYGLVNAVLRRGAGEARPIVAALGDETPSEAALKYSHPLWVAELWWSMLGPVRARSLMERNNEPAESAVRANTLRVEARRLVEELATERVSARRDALLEEAVVLEQPYDVHGSDLFAHGKLMPQARASMLVARVTDPRRGDRVLDLCCAPGAKTTHLAALMGDEGEVVGVDRDPRRLEAVTMNCERLGVRSVTTRAGDATNAEFGEGFDRVLVDPPCSDLGTLQSRPDARWRKDAATLDRLRSVQQEILAAGARAVRPGGRLVYSTCTISEQENELQIEGFLADRSDFQPLDLSGAYPPFLTPKGYLQTLPDRDRTDGFFIAAFERSQ